MGLNPGYIIKLMGIYVKVSIFSFLLGKIITEILQHLHACNDSVKVFYGRTDELKKLKNYICGESTMPFVLYGAGGSGKTAMISIAAAKGLQEWLKPAKPLLIGRYSRNFLRTLSSIDLISLKIQIVGRNLFKHPGFKSSSGKVKFFCPVFFSFS